MKPEKTGGVTRVFVALGKAVAYLALFLGCQTAVAWIFIAISALWMTLQGGGLDEELLYETANSAAIGLTLLSGLLTLAIIAAFYLIRRKKLREALWLRPVSGQSLWAGAALAPMLYIVVALVLAALPQEWIESYDQAASSLEDASLLAFVSIVLVSPVVEEVIFRGLILTRLSRAMPGWLAVTVSATIFGWCHGEFVWFCYAFVLGLLFGLMDLRAGSLLPSILAHITFNGIGQMFTILNVLFPESELSTLVVYLLFAIAIVCQFACRSGIQAIFRPGTGATVPFDAPYGAASYESTPSVEDRFTVEGTYSARSETFEADPWSD